MPKKLSIYTYNDILFVRFINIPTKKDFEKLRECFVLEFPHTSWDNNQKAWRLMQSDMGQLTLFSYRFYGYNTIVYEQVSTT